MPGVNTSEIVRPNNRFEEYSTVVVRFHPRQLRISLTTVPQLCTLRRGKRKLGKLRPSPTGFLLVHNASAENYFASSTCQDTGLPGADVFTLEVVFGAWKSTFTNCPSRARQMSWKGLFVGRLRSTKTTLQRYTLIFASEIMPLHPRRFACRKSPSIHNDFVSVGSQVRLKICTARVVAVCPSAFEQPKKNLFLSTTPSHLCAIYNKFVQVFFAQPGSAASPIPSTTISEH